VQLNDINNAETITVKGVGRKLPGEANGRGEWKNQVRKIAPIILLLHYQWRVRG